MFKGGVADMCAKILVRVEKGTKDQMCMHADSESEEPHWHEQKFSFI